MTPTGAISGFGTLLKIGDGATPTEGFTTIAEVKDIGGPKLKADTAEATSHSSTDGWDEAIATILRGGEVPFDVNWIPTNATHSLSTGILKDFNARTRRNFKIVFPDAGNTTWQFSAIIVGFEVEAPVNGILKSSITLKITGKPTLA